MKSILFGASLLLSAGALATDARADVSARFERLGRLRKDVLAARGPHVYAALRRLWQEWDQGDPAEVEALLHEATTSTRLSPPTRVYAGLLEAYGRRRRGDLDGAEQRITRLGYLGKFMIAGPFDNEGKAGLDRAFGPEEDLDKPLDVGRSYEGKERPVKWRAAPAVSPYGWFDLGVFVRPQENVCAYATTYVRARGGARPVSLWAGSAGAMRVFWNGKEVARDAKYRALDAERVAATVLAREGWNRLVVKVCGDDSPPMLSIRVAAADGAPDDRIEADPDPRHGAEELGKGGPAPAARLEGPVQTFDRLTKAGRDATALEAYARYLVTTQSDDPAEHPARELARRAAEVAPTIPRLLLAGDLAEDRNQRAIWIERAEARVRGAGAEDQMAVLLARAAHARAGANWRDAVPFYDRALVLDPDDVTAVLARVELYGEAGLRETALTFLSDALARRPRSVALLRAMASALRSESRTLEADEVAERYAELRFDDPVFVRDRIDLAVASRKPEAAVRWLGRLLAANPDSASALGVAARTYLQLGERTRALAAFKRALDFAPEDVDAMRSLADTYALGGAAAEQLALLRRVVELRPQDKDARDYLAHTQPDKSRADEAYARPATEFLKQRGAPTRGENRRTLVDVHVTTVFPNGLASRFHQVVFQPLTEAAAAGAREYSFAFESDTETVQLRGARVHRVNGQVDEAVETGEGNVDDPSMSMYSSARAYYVHFPRLNPGDVVELQYRVEDVAQRNAFADYFGEVTFLQSGEPVGRSEYVLITPKSRTFYFNEPRVPGLSRKVEESKDARIYRFLAENVAPVTPEPLQPPYAELLGHVHVSTYKTWDAMAQWYWGLVKDQLIPDDEVRRRTAEITRGLKDDRAKVRAVYDYVVQKTRYVALEFGIHGFKPYRCAQIFARGFGDCKDKATLIVTMLKELGIGATLVIVRTGNRGQIATEPASLAPFDHAIAYVPSLDLYLDGTAEYTGSTELPAMDRGALALQVNEGKPKLVHLPDPPASESVMSRRVEATVAPDGSAQIDWRAELSGVSASSWRRRYVAATQRKARVQEDLARDFAGIELASVETGDLEDIEQKVTMRAKGRAPSLGRKDGSTVTFPVGPGEHMVRDFAALSQRRLDVKIPAQTTTESEWTVRIPAGMKVVTAPVSSEGQSPFGSYKVEVESGDAAVRAKTTIVMAKTRIAAAEYAAFRAFCEKVDGALGQRVVLGSR